MSTITNNEEFNLTPLLYKIYLMVDGVITIDYSHYCIVRATIKDGKKCGLVEKECCTRAPWFHKHLTRPTTD